MTQVTDEAVLKMLNELADALGDEAVVSVIDVYIENSANQMRQMEEAVIYSDMAKLRHEAHSLKSSSANLGAMDLAGQCSKIEKSPEFTAEVAEMVKVSRTMRDKALISMEHWKKSKAA